MLQHRFSFWKHDNSRSWNFSKTPLLQIQATKATADAAKAAQASTIPTPSASVDLFKLLNKPPAFDESPPMMRSRPFRTGTGSLAKVLKVN